MYKERKRKSFQFSFLTLFLGISMVSLVGTALCIDGIATFGIIGAGEYLGAKNSDQVIVPALGIAADGSTQLNALSGEAVVQTVAKTPVASTDANGTTYAIAGAQPIYPAAGVITPATALTPVAGAYLTSVRNIIATAAPTLAVVFIEPTKAVGKSISVYNKGASPLVIIPTDGGINATAVLTPYSCATTKLCRCDGQTTSQMTCVSQ